MLSLQKRDYKGIAGCVSLTNGTVELIITVGYGPRILAYGFCGEQNFFKIFDEQLHDVARDTWHCYGGHRLWHAPEVQPRTYYPDNDPVAYTWEDGVLRLTTPVEQTTGIAKIIEIALDESGTGVRLKHTLINRHVWDVELAAWCLSVMAPGGRAVIPHEEFRPHPEALLPARPLVLWPFTKMNDPRFMWGERYIQIREDSAAASKQKIGVLNKQGWAAYILGEQVFIKHHAYQPEAVYPDYGCNAEFYTEPGFLEIESLSPLTRLAPGAKLEHAEQWSLHKAAVGETEGELAKVVTLL